MEKAEALEGSVWVCLGLELELLESSGPNRGEGGAEAPAAGFRHAQGKYRASVFALIHGASGPDMYVQ